MGRRLGEQRSQRQARERQEDEAAAQEARAQEHSRAAGRLALEILGLMDGQNFGTALEALALTIGTVLAENRDHSRRAIGLSAVMLTAHQQMEGGREVERAVIPIGDMAEFEGAFEEGTLPAIIDETMALCPVLNDLLRGLMAHTPPPIVLNAWLSAFIVPILEIDGAAHLKTVLEKLVRDLPEIAARLKAEGRPRARRAAQRARRRARWTGV